MSFLICGVDEVGRGALAGPLIAVASLFSSDPNPRYWEKEHSPIKGVIDSKKFSKPEKRREVYHRILRHQSLLDFGLGEVSVEEIDRVGIDRANSMAFDRAVKQLRVMPHYIIVDGVNPVFGWDMDRQRTEAKADDKYWPVGAASILAKVIRDTYMTELGSDYAHYQWSKNAGYGTKDHLDALRTVGACPHHRKAFIKSVGRAV
jgi:ribonuclease HII